MRNAETIAHQQKLLAMYRELLGEYVRQREMWEPAEVPVVLKSGISQMRTHIAYTKAALRTLRVPVADHPNDEPGYAWQPDEPSYAGEGVRPRPGPRTLLV